MIKKIILILVLDLVFFIGLGLVALLLLPALSYLGSWATSFIVLIGLLVVQALAIYAALRVLEKKFNASDASEIPRILAIVFVALALAGLFGEFAFGDFHNAGTGLLNLLYGAVSYGAAKLFFAKKLKGN